MPFSSQLNLLGNPVPYWYYISQNNIPKEQIPSQNNMEQDLANFIYGKIAECNFDDYYSEGFKITEGTPTATVTINNANVGVNLNMDLTITKGNDTALIHNHQITVQSKLGELYNSAIQVYEKEKQESFLENYGIDTLRLSAPVDGVDLTCGPEMWDADNVFTNLSGAIETNTLALTTKNPSTSDEKYFYVNTGLNEGVRFINSAAWPHSYEVNPTSGRLMIASPVGDQQGLGIIGFCYVLYHFVYNINYPVLAQVYDGDETFQFPVAVVIQGNEPRQALNSSASSITPDLCLYNNTLATINTYDSDSNPINANISYECFGQSCNIGATSSGTLTANLPQCVNGYIVADAPGFKETKFLYSSNTEGNAAVIMNKLYNLNISLKVDGANYYGDAMIYFASQDGTSETVYYPMQKNVQLSEGQYNISIYTYKNSSINFPQTTTQQCTDVPSSGIGGIFGFTDKKCFDVTIPSQIISNVLSGGGQSSSYFLENDLKNSKSIEIDSKGMLTPQTIEQLQNNYITFDNQEAQVSLND
jgi:hypothetical protein